MLGLKLNHVSKRGPRVEEGHMEDKYLPLRNGNLKSQPPVVQEDIEFAHHVDKLSSRQPEEDDVLRHQQSSVDGAGQSVCQRTNCIHITYIFTFCEGNIASLYCPIKSGQILCCDWTIDIYIRNGKYRYIIWYGVDMGTCPQL